MQILTIVIGIIFVLLLLSLLATTMMELLSSFFKLRGRNLIKALRNMLASSDEQAVLMDEFRSNSLYRQLTQRYGRARSGFDAPSYMSAETFQSILMDVVLKGAPVEELEDRINALPDEDLRNVLNQLLRESGGQLDLFKLEVQNWYNNVMDRAAGWYKRYTQKILLFMGIGIAVIFNADTVALYDRLSNDPETLEQLANAAEQYVRARDEVGLRVRVNESTGERIPTTVPGQQPPPDAGTTFATDPNAPAAPTGGSTTDAAPAPGPATDYVPVDPTAAPATYLYKNEQPGQQDFRESLEDLKFLLNNEIAEVRRPLGLGWDGVSLSAMTPYDLATKMLGWVLTALAISLGAPFWFDLLKKLVNIRSAGSRPYEDR